MQQVDRLIWAASLGYADIVDVLLKYGAHVNARDKHGATALMKAARRGYWSVAQILLRAGANPDATDVDGFQRADEGLPRASHKGGQTPSVRRGRSPHGRQRWKHAVDSRGQCGPQRSRKTYPGEEARSAREGQEWMDRHDVGAIDPKREIISLLEKYETVDRTDLTTLSCFAAARGHQNGTS